MFASHRLHGSSSDDAQNQAGMAKAMLRRASLCLLCLAVMLSGCGSETRLPVFPVIGSVSFKGQKPVGALVVLHAAEGAGQSDLAPTATVKEDGSFQITSYDIGDGAPQGEYVATVQWFKVVPEGGRGPNVLPKKYSDPKTTPVKVSVGGGPTQIPPISI